MAGLQNRLFLEALRERSIGPGSLFEISGIVMFTVVTPY